MKTLNEILLKRKSSLDEAFRTGASRTSPGDRREARSRQAAVRVLHDLKEAYSPLLTGATGNAKLAKASVPTVGLTLQHYVQKLSTGLTVNACEWAGQCTKVCVLDNGYGIDPRVQRARRAKTEFFARYPAHAAFLLGWELADAIDRHGYMLFRPNVNSDVSWHEVLPAMVDGSVFGDDMTAYGYTKDPAVLDTDGWLAGAYRVAYSWNENSDPDAVEEFITAGGSVAVVTSRRKGAPLPDCIKLGRWEYREGGDDTPHIVDADLTDEWIFQPGSIGDLSAKGRARKLIGKGGFVYTPKEAA
jgi:hypothetical protein